MSAFALCSLLTSPISAISLTARTSPTPPISLTVVYSGKDFARTCIRVKIADDVLYTYQILKDNPIFDRFGLWNRLEEIRKDGENVTFVTKTSFVSLPEYLSKIYIVPKHIWEKEDAASFTNTKPIGTGPFIYDQYTTGTAITFKANKDYWKGAPKLDQAMFLMYNSAPNCTLALLKGEIDCTTGTISMSSIPEFMSKPNAKLQTYPGLGNFNVMMNHENELLADKNVRKAMAMAINQSELITKGEYNGVLPTYISWLPDLFGDYINKEAANSLEYNLEEAKKLLEDSGYTKGKDGIYEKDGKRLSFTYHNASGAPAQQMEAGMIQQWLLNLGIEIIPKLATWPELTQLQQTGDFDLIQNNITFPPDPYAALNTSFHSSMTAPVGEDYIMLAQAKGLKRGKILSRYALRNALLPSFTGLMLSLGQAVGGAIATELIFSYPGIGLTIMNAILSHDYPLIQGCFAIIAVSVVSINFLADLIYPLIDPRVSLS